MYLLIYGVSYVLPDAFGGGGAFFIVTGE